MFAIFTEEQIVVSALKAQACFEISGNNECDYCQTNKTDGFQDVNGSFRHSTWF